MGKFWKLSCLLLLIIFNLFSDVVFESAGTTTQPDPNLSVMLRNNTPSLWKAGGVRFRNEGFNWATVYGYTAINIANKPFGSKNEVEIIIKSNAQGQETKILPFNTFPFEHAWVTNPIGANIDSTYTPEVLIRTGAAGKIDDPIDPDPISITQLDSLMKTDDFYSSTYRYSYTDSLGVNGGLYSGGFMDTWYNLENDFAETQLLLAIPEDTFTLNNFDINIDTSATQGPMYWMTLAVAQEYFKVDYQWMMAMGIKENDAGVKKQHYPNDVVYDSTTNHNSGLGPWQTEAVTGVDRALTYPNYFPKFETDMASNVNTTSFLTDIGDGGLGHMVTDYYCGVNSHIASAKIVNTMIFSVLVQYANYDVFAYCTDICWKEALPIAADPYMGLSAMCAVYNGGNSKVKNIAGDLNSGTYGATAANPNANELWHNLCIDATYIPKMLIGVQNFVDASKKSKTVNSIKMLDYPISKSELLNLFFGDNGTVAAQGNGGILLHFFDNTVTDCNTQRQMVWDTLSAAFDLVVGKSPSTLGTDSISLRYDFLSILRTVKEPFRFTRRPPAGGDALDPIIPLNSGNYSPCNGELSSDEKYPYAYFDTDYNVANDDFIVYDTVVDETAVNKVKWSLDYNWVVWFDAEAIDTSNEKKRVFKITIPKLLVEQYRNLDTLGSGKYVWVFSEDGAGNSVVSKLPVPYKSPEFIDSVAAYDNDGDGIADNLKAYMQPGGNDTLENFDKITYQWTTASSIKTIYKGDSKVSVTGKVIQINDAFTEGAGIGDFNMWVDTAYGIYDPDNFSGTTVAIGPKEIVDRVGPAIEKTNPIPVYILPVTSADLDTLTLAFTEPIKDLANSGTYLEFKTGNGTATSHLASNINKNSTTNYTFVFPNNTLGSYDSVRIVSSSDLQDEVGNGAAGNNQWAPISPKGSDDPEWVYGYIKDADADGYGDNITFTIKIGNSDGAYTVADIDSFTYKWNKTNGTETELSSSEYTTSGDNGVSFSFDEDANGLYGSGEGSVFMLFEKSSNEFPLSGTIVDSVGPAIISAEYIVGKDNGLCTLTIILTEDIEDDLDAGTQYLVLDDGTKISQSAINKKSETEYEFILTPGTIEDGDKVKLIHDSGLTDASNQKNPPLENNILQDIIYIDAINKITSVEYYDSDGNGTMDKVVINFVSSVDQTEDVDKMSFVINWLDEDGNAIAMNVSGTDFVKIDAKKIEWTVNSNNYDLKDDLTTLDGGYGHVSITQPNENTGSNETTNYGDTIAVDKMAPVLILASYYKFKGAKPDELKVTFSENVQFNSAILPDGEPFDFFNGSTPYDMELEPINYVVGTSGIEPSSTITFKKLTGGTPVGGDKLNIDHIEKVIGEDGNVQDVAENQYVILGVFSAISINNVSYHDISTPRDGFIDRIKVVTDTAVSAGLFDSLVTKVVLNSARGFESLEVSDFSIFADENDTGFIISVTQSAVGVNTAVDTSLDKFMITGEVKTDAGFMMYDTVDIRDSLAPVIVAANLYPVEITTDNFQDQLSDTLKIKYSEAVDYDAMSDNPLKFKKVDGTSIDVDLEKDTTEGSNVVIYMVDYNSDKPKDGDSVQILTSSNVADTKSNIQDEDNIFVELKVAAVPFHWNIGVYPNPVLKSNEDQVKEKKTNLADYLQISSDDIEKGAQAIVLDPLGPAPSSDGLEITITIYDALGHVIVEEEALEVSSDGEIWYYLWNGQNKKGRDVGSGLYLAYIKITPESMGVISEPLKLGVGK